ncbi:hypothetical protein KBTX_03564 [wastewater metagenome]|uniref:General secretion pathway GspH domain-containing protein n=2 Tax=unclassified sequences TaxID=12908 RepID=A0A5B8RF59_9ZZZZ|nr:MULTISPECIES: GspH/FimT family pseudopilin [Arhodomonas]QEA07216.1 hypothetical protein KBTEX_03564 [uncultured organism]
MHRRGFTLIELLVTVALLAAILGIAIPTLSTIVRSTALSSSTNRFLTTLAFARSEAVKRGERITVRRSGTDWSAGWVVFVDRDGSGDRNNTEPLLRDSRALRDGFRLTGNQMVSESLSYIPQGYPRTASGALQMGTFTVCDDTGITTAGHARAVVISATGRARVSHRISDIDKNDC